MAAQDESLRLVAEVVDKFSTPLRNLRTMLQGVQNPAAVEKMKAGFEGTQKAATALSREVSNTLTPALNAAGIAGLSISGALLGAGAALRAFTGSTAGLVLLNRETGMAVQSMRVLEEVGKRFDIAPEAMQQSFRTFAENAQQLRKGVGDVTGFLSSQSPAIAKWAADLRRDLNNGLNPDEAYKRALEFMRRIEDPIDRGKFAEKLFGSKQLGVLGSENLGALIAEVERQIGKLPKGAAESALAFKRAWDDVTSSLIGLRDTLGVTVLPMFKDLLDVTSKWLSDPAVKNGLAATFNELQEALRKFNWKQFRAEMGDFFGAIISEGKGAIETIKLFAQVISALGEGRIMDAIKLLDSKPVLPQGALGRPRTEAETRAQSLETRRDQVQRLLNVFDGNPANRRDPDGAAQRDRLVKELESLTREIEQLRRQGEEARVQQQSFTGGGAFGGAMIQNAAFGAMVASGGAARGLSSPWGGGGRFPILRGGGSDGVRRTREALTGEASIMAPKSMLDLIAKAEGTTKRGYNDSFAHQLSGDLTGKTMGEIEQIQRGMRGSSAIGRYQFMRETLFGKRGVPGLVDELGINRGEKFTPELQDRMASALIERRYRRALKAHREQGGDFMAHFRTELAREWASFPGDYGQKGINGGMYPGQRASVGRDLLTRFAQDWLDKRQGKSRVGQDGTPEAPRLAPGAGADLMNKALKSPMMGAPAVDLRGGATLDINFRNAPPGMSTNSTSDGILKDLSVRRSSAIPKAGVDI
jgi:muramidase (phage lysozyme)